MAPPSGRTARRTRPSYLAAPPLLAESEPFEGAALLQEHAGPLGVVLWKTLRDVSLWAQTPPERRAALFPAGAGERRLADVAACDAGAELWAPLLAVAQLLERPADEPLRRVVHACRSVARWAEQRQAPATQLAFTQAAALMVPDSPRLAYAVGRLARERAEHARAESWLRRAVKLARGRDWEFYVRAYLSLGTLYQLLGNGPAARALTRRGLRGATRHRLRGLCGTAMHNLFVLAAEAHDAPAAHDNARGALKAYGAEHPRLPVLAHDVACFWMNQGMYREALPVLDAVLPHIGAGSDRAAVMANLARAAAGAGDRPRFEISWAGAVQAMGASWSDETAADTYLALARGATLLGDWERAEDTAATALAIATRRKQAQAAYEAEAARDAARGARRALSVAPAAPALARQAEELGGALVHSLAGRLAAAGTS
jgi:hypothetical protein